MTARYITLGDGRKIGLGKYVAAWKQCLELPPKTFIGKGIDGWGQTAGEALADLRKGMHHRINRHIPGFGKGRKWCSDRYWAVWRASRDLNTPRLVIRWLPPELKARFAHRLAD